MPEAPSINVSERSRKTSVEAKIALTEGQREDIRTWLQLVKAVLPMERDANRLFAKEFGQSLARFDVLAQLDLAGSPGLPVGTLAERLIASAGNITRLIARMTAEGLVTQSTDPSDRRREIVSVTAAGLSLYRDMAERHAAWASERLANLEDAEKANVRQLMRKIRRRADG